MNASMMSPWMSPRISPWMSPSISIYFNDFKSFSDEFMSIKYTPWYPWYKMCIKYTPLWYNPYADTICTVTQSVRWHNPYVYTIRTLIQYVRWHNPTQSVRWEHRLVHGRTDSITMEYILYTFYTMDTMEYILYT